MTESRRLSRHPISAVSTGLFLNKPPVLTHINLNEERHLTYGKLSSVFITPSGGVRLESGRVSSQNRQRGGQGSYCLTEQRVKINVSALCEGFFVLFSSTESAVLAFYDSVL